MRVDLFDFDLPERLIALRPLSRREEARLLVIDGAARADRRIGDLPSLLRPGDALVLNTTKVIPAALTARRPRRETGGAGEDVTVELTLLKRLEAARWTALARPARRLRPGDALVLDDALQAEVIDKREGGQVTLAFSTGGAALDAAVSRLGAMPLPPYIARRRPPDERDRRDYQTVYARTAGAVAAPTAGLHLTADLLARLAARGVERIDVTLHVGAGTFLPVKAEDTADHVMHSEWGEVTAAAAARLNAIRGAGGRIVAVGTTSLRLLETAVNEAGRFHSFRGETDIFITPGHEIRSADLLMTNFHLPRSTLFMLVCAFGGTEALKAAYAHAISREYRFYSYGDACLIRRRLAAG